MLQHKATFQNRIPANQISLYPVTKHQIIGPFATNANCILLRYMLLWLSNYNSRNHIPVFTETHSNSIFATRQLARACNISNQQLYIHKQQRQKEIGFLEILRDDGATIVSIADVSMCPPSDVPKPPDGYSWYLAQVLPSPCTFFNFLQSVIIRLKRELMRWRRY